ncbi:hypothetical protein KP79_PYT20636 [Mizuhopecten yessoensis]|uniref:Uncharacterized protein n=1 Tax=Mizuhopecten yessoensis TaxID=6573 RepID=A0A210QTH6_MIZYE|nr:hypothetical protein KP79_PYT20636 [Mizuhopecten yessoensis]
MATTRPEFQTQVVFTVSRDSVRDSVAVDNEQAGVYGSHVKKLQDIEPLSSKEKMKAVFLFAFPVVFFVIAVILTALNTP